MPLQSTRAQSISSQEQVQHQNAKKPQHREQQLPYFTSVNSNVTDNYSASVLIETSPWTHLTVCTPCHEAGATPMHGPLTPDQRHAEFAMCTSQKRTFGHCRHWGGSLLAYALLHSTSCHATLTAQATYNMLLPPVFKQFCSCSLLPC